MTPGTLVLLEGFLDGRQDSLGGLSSYGRGFGFLDSFLSHMLGIPLRDSVPSGRLSIMSKKFPKPMLCGSPRHLNDPIKRKALRLIP